MTLTIFGLAPYREEVRGLVRDLRCIWVLEEIGAPFTHKILDPKAKEHKSPAYLKINPFGKVPAMTDGEIVMFESSAICTYIADKYHHLIPPQGDPLRYKYHQWMAFFISTFEPWVSRVVSFDKLSDEKNDTTAALRKQAMDMVESFLTVLNQELSARPYMLGAEFSVIDIIFSSGMMYVAHTNVVEKFPAVQAYLQRNYERPAFQKAAATQH